MIPSALPRLIVAVGIIVLVGIITAGFSGYVIMRQVPEQRRWVIHTHQVINTLNVMQAYMLAVKHNQNLADSTTLRERLRDTRLALVELVVDNQEQTSRTRQLQSILRGPGDNNSYSEMIDRALEVVEDMKDSEADLLQRRTTVLNAENVRAQTFFLVLVFSSALALGVSIIFLRRYLRDKLIAEAMTEEKRKILEMEFSIARTLVESRDLRETCELALRETATSIGWEYAALWLMEGDSQLVCNSLWTTSELESSDFVKESRNRVFVPGEGLPGRAWEKGDIEWVEDARVNDNFPRAPLARACGFRTGFAVPVKVGGDLLGVVELFSRSEARPDDAWLQAVAVMGTEIGQLIARSRNEMELAETEKRLRQVVESAPSAVFLINTSGDIELVNRHAERLFGYSRQELMELEVLNLVPEKYDGLEPRKVLEEILKNPASREGIILAGTRFDGTSFPAEVSSSPVSMEGDNNQMLLMFADVTARREAEKRVSEFYSTVSHELRTPLTSIRGALGLLAGGRAGELSAKAQRLVQIGQDESDRLIRLINDMLDIRKIEAGMFELKLSESKSRDLVQSCADNLKGFASEAGVRIVVDVRTESAIACDPDRLMQVLTNLTANAIKFSEKDKVVVLKAELRNDNRVRFSIIDEGPGIAEGDLGKLFGKFKQLDSSDSRAKGGTGLGLAVSKGLVELHGGSIGVESVLGMGSTFWFEIPCFAAKETVSEPVNAPAASRLLLVDDDEKLVKVLKEVLESDGFAVTCAGTVKDAIGRLDESYQLVLLDLGLPDGSGIEVIEKLRQSDKLSGIPVVMITGTLPDGNLARPLVTEWLTKPFAGDALVNVVRRSLKGKRERRAQILVVEDDLATREVIREQLSSLGVDVLEAEDGAAAMELLKSCQPDLIVLDVILPISSGFEVVDSLRDLERSEMPLVVYTSSELTQDERKSLTLGLTEHLTKSRTTSEEFVETVRRLLNGLLEKRDGD